MMAYDHFFGHPFPPALHSQHEPIEGWPAGPGVLDHDFLAFFVTMLKC